jgi:hypothetical protein
MQKTSDIQEFQMNKQIAASVMALALAMGPAAGAMPLGHGGDGGVGGHVGCFGRAYVGGFSGRVGGL